MSRLGKLLIFSLMLCFFPLLGTAVAELEIPSVKVEKVPVLDGAGMDSAWQGLKPVTVKDSASGTNILIRSVYTADQVFFLVQFPDNAENFLHKPWVWNATEKKYETGPHREDTFVFKWNMMDHDVNLSNFSDDDYRADVWYWKANRTNSAGYADDKSQVLAAQPIEKSTELTSTSGKARHLGRYSDAGKAAYKELKELTEYQGDLVDRYPASTPEGSRADVHAKGSWNGGFRTIEYARALNTGHDDDLQFEPAVGKAYLFGVSIFSLYGRPHIVNSPNFYGRGRISEPLRLKFQ